LALEECACRLDPNAQHDSGSRISQSVSVLPGPLSGSVNLLLLAQILKIGVWTKRIFEDYERIHPFRHLFQKRNDSIVLFAAAHFTLDATNRM